MDFKQVSYEKALRVMQMKGAVVNITPSINQYVDKGCVEARCHLNLTVMFNGFLYSTTTDVNSKRYCVRTVVKDNKFLTRNGMRSYTLEDLLKGGLGSIAENKVELTVVKNIGDIFK